MRLITISLIIVAGGLVAGCQSNLLQPPTASEAAQEDLPDLLDPQKKLQADSAAEAIEKARAACGEGKLDLAQALYIKAFDLDPKNAELLAEMANFYRRIGKTDLVETCYKLILQQDPQHAVLEQYALLLLQSRKNPEAEVALQGAVQRGSSNWQVYNALGIIKDLQGDHVAAQGWFQQALKLQPSNVETLNNLGYSHYMSGDLDAARQYLQKVLQINPKFKKAFYNQALIEIRLRHYDSALYLFQKAVPPAEAENNVGYSAMKNGDYAIAEEHLNQAVKLSPSFYEKAENNKRELEELKNQQVD